MSSSDSKPGPKPGPWPPAPESSAMPPSTWAKRTGFRPKFSGETTATDSGQVPLPASVRARQIETQPDLEAGQPRLRPPPGPAVANGEMDKDKKEKPPQPPPPPPPPPPGAGPVKRRRDSDGATGRSNGPGGGNGSGDPIRRPTRIEETVEVLPQSVDDDLVARSLHMKYGLRDTPGLGERYFNYFEGNHLFNCLLLLLIVT